MQFYIKTKPRFINLQIPRPGQAPVIIAGIDYLDKSHLKELIAKINETYGIKFTEADVDKQIEERIKGIYKRKPTVRQVKRDQEAMRRIMMNKL